MTKIRISVLLLSLFFVCPALQAQSDVNKFFETGGDFYSAPFHFDNKDWTNLSITVAATAGSFFLDKPVKRLFLRNKNDVADFIFEIDKYFYVEGAAIGIAGTYLYGVIADDSKIKNLGLQLAEASFYSGTITLLTKAVFGRKRPNSHCGCSSFNPFTLDLEKSALPSVHSTLAFAFSTVMANYKDNTAWKAGWYTLASLVAMARIYHNYHWFSDVILGAAIGYFTGEFVSNLKTNKEEVAVPINVIPSQNLISFKINF